LPIVEILEFKIPEKIYRDFVLVIRADDRFRGRTLAFSTVKPPQIVVRDRIYRDALHGDLFARHTLAHELGHIYLAHQEDDEDLGWSDEFASSLEWEANEFAWEFLMPSRAAQKMTICEIASRFTIPPELVRERLDLICSREESPRLRESFWANSLLHRPLNSRLYSSRPEFLNVIHSRY
jgi:hypothetical protein